MNGKKEPGDEKDYPEPLRMKEGLSLTLFSWDTGCSPMEIDEDHRGRLLKPRTGGFLNILKREDPALRVFEDPTHPNSQLTWQLGVVFPSKGVVFGWRLFSP